MNGYSTAKTSAPVAPRLVVESVEQRKRIVASTHDGSHLGLNRTNDMVASKYYWPGLFTDVKEYVSYTLNIHNCDSNITSITSLLLHYIAYNTVSTFTLYSFLTVTMFNNSVTRWSPVIVANAETRR